MSKFVVPAELRAFNSWVCWGASGAEDPKVPVSPVTGKAASVIDSSTWVSFDEAVTYASTHNYQGVGFVLSSNDPFALIDLDDPEGDPKFVEQQMEIFRTFDSYAELSPSGKGLHIIVQGSVPRGRRRNKVEVYSRARYMTVTGNVFRHTSIKPYQMELERLFVELGGRQEPFRSILEEEQPEHLTDEEVLARAASAKNGEAFQKLYDGNWQDKYLTQSEGDFALIDMLAFYTQSKAQITRLFQQSGMRIRLPGKDPHKVFRQDYIGWMLNRCFDNILPPVDIEFAKQAIETKLAEPKFVEPDIKREIQSVYTFPPGLVGEIAQFFLDQSPRPAKEMALAASLGFMAGLVGRAYNVSDSGLNQYILLLAGTGSGKEGMASGINKLISIIRSIYPGISSVMGPGEIASPQALVKFLNGSSKSFVSVLGEFGLALQEMCDRRATPNKIGLRRIILDLFNKSGKGQELQPMVYSDKDKNTKVIKSPAVSFLGESTPEKFYQALNEDMIAEGLLPRFLTIEYFGKRPKMNYRHTEARPSQDLIYKLASLAQQCAAFNGRDDALDVAFTVEANEYFADFNDHCDRMIDESPDEDIEKQLWNRAHFKALRLAALVAVGINPFSPVIDIDSARWAKDIILADCRNLVKRFKTGEFGSFADEATQIRKVASAIREFLVTPLPELYKFSRYVNNLEAFYEQKVVPMPFIQRKLLNAKEFKNDKFLKPTESIKKAIKTMVETGDISELGLIQRQDRFGVIHACYTVRNLHLLDESYLVD